MARSLDDITPIFVMGYGRSGTTLLRRVLNSYDDVFLWGEHHGFLQYVARGFYRIWDGDVVFDDTRPWQQRVVDPRHASAVSQSWLNSFDRQAWLDVHRGYLDSIFLPVELNDLNFVGFKGICMRKRTPSGRVSNGNLPLGGVVHSWVQYHDNVG